MKSRTPLFFVFHSPWLLLGVALWNFVACAPSPAQERLRELIEKYENYKAYDEEAFPLGDYSEERFVQQALFWEKCLTEANQIEHDKLNDEEQISLELLCFLLKNKLGNFEFKTHYNPILSDAGFHNSLVYKVQPLTTKEEVYDYLRLLKSIPKFVNQNIVLIQKGIELGISQPKVIFKGYESTYNQHITASYADNFYYKPFLSLPLSFTPRERDSLRLLAQQTVQDLVIPSFKQIKTFFEMVYLPQTRDAIGVSETPNGSAYYENRIAYYTTLSYSAKEIHEIGLREVETIRQQMEAIIQAVQFEGSFSEFIEFLRTDPQFYVTSGETLLVQARDISKRLDEQLPRFFKTLPRKPYGVAPVPSAIAPKYTAGRYIGTAPESNDPGYYWVNTYNLPSRPLYTLPALTAHEAVPGHHLQIALNGELPGELPQFRRDLYLSAYGEGWGLYTESLAGEMGIYRTPYERFGQLTYSMWRACRLVVDTGIHVFGWSRDQAVNYMAKNTALSLHEINTEVDRYISWPGQALAYKIGELKIKALRTLAEQALGENFDIREFHEVILKKGTLTLPLMEQEVLYYIESYNESN